MYNIDPTCLQLIELIMNVLQYRTTAGGLDSKLGTHISQLQSSIISGIVDERPRPDALPCPDVGRPRRGQVLPGVTIYDFRVSARI